MIKKKPHTSPKVLLYLSFLSFILSTCVLAVLNSVC